MIKNARFFAAIAVMLTSVALAAPSQASGLTDLAHLHAGDGAKPPIGWTQFCSDNPRDCVPQAGARVVELDNAKWGQLVETNLKFNKAIEAVTDMEQFGVVERWSYATTGRGDCEDYVLEKRRDLARRGWPLSALLVTVVIDREGGGHAVLTVITNRGEFVLDNQTDKILPWSRSGLTFIKRQAPDNPNVWADLGRVLGRPDTATASISRLR